MNEPHVRDVLRVLCRMRSLTAGSLYGLVRVEGPPGAPDSYD